MMFIRKHIVFPLLLAILFWPLLIVAQTDNSSENPASNIFFHDVVKLTEPVSRVGFPFIGDTHFKNYEFVNEKNGIFKHNYFLAGGEFYPSFYLFNKPPNRFNLRISIGTRIRVWNERREPLRTAYTWRASHAIKTPSFVPSANFSFLLDSSQDDDNFTLHFMQLAYTHHSNGQDAPTLVSQDSTLNLPTGIKYNIEDGDFSTNFLTLSYFRVRHLGDEHLLILSAYGILDELASEKSVHRDLHKYKFGLEQRWFSCPTTSEKGRRLAFRNRLDFKIQFGMRSFSDVSLRKNISYSIGYHHRLPFSDMVALYVRYGYWGQDEYNIFLENSFHYFHIGVSFSHFGIDRMK